MGTIIDHDYVQKCGVGREMVQRNGGDAPIIIRFVDAIEEDHGEQDQRQRPHWVGFLPAS